MTVYTARQHPDKTTTAKLYAEGPFANVLEAGVNDEGWGYLVMLQDKDTGAQKMWVDGQWQQFLYRGVITFA